MSDTVERLLQAIAQLVVSLQACASAERQQALSERIMHRPEAARARDAAATAYDQAAQMVADHIEVVAR